ncbi:MAG: dihydrolipoamide acetyltransferase family protein [Oscillospiraceae bacterium]|nr:dihydrolipoamide acetyltransferase family protein [Oscillospiraceae bacterium]
MVTPVIMPRQGQSVESCAITSWKKSVGDEIKIGDVLFSYETDKSSFDEISTVEGTLLAILKEEGEDVPCLENVCIIGSAGEDISSFTGASAMEKHETISDADKAKSDQSASSSSSASSPVPGIVISSEGIKADISKISPRAKFLAVKTGADLLKAIPSGPDGRIIERDIVSLLDKGYTVSAAAKDNYITAAEGSGIGGRVVIADTEKSKSADINVVVKPELKEQQSATDYTDVPLTNIRKVIAKSMQASLANMAQLTLNSSFDATKLQALRANLKTNAEKLKLENITLNDMILFAVARTIGSFKELNAHLLDNKIRYFNSVNLGVAVDTDRGLMVPTLFNADKLSLNELSRRVKELITEAQSGSINPDKLQGATFTVSNLGAMGIESFTPVINPPQTGILGVDTITRRVKEVNGADVFYPAMGLSLTFDHRALDGAPAAKFLKALCANLESFDLLLIK